MKKFYSIEQVWEYYFPRETAEKRDRELRENDPEEWMRQKVQESLNRAFAKVRLHA
jgi:hypothetical protein